MQTTFIHKKETFRDNHIFVLYYPMHLCVYTKYNTLYISQYNTYPDHNIVTTP